jgi:transcriptional regulator with AAA-type ATPase domain/tetratricopeptide (TPR) repeat protein
MDALVELVGDSPSIAALRRQVRGLLQRRVGTRRLPPILIQGETGTGKGLLARLMHRVGPHASGPFIDVNCAAIPETMLEAEMFGYERGAFTDARQSKAGLFEAADSGTLFLDEVGLLPPGLQGKLLSAIDQGSVRRLGSTKSVPVSVSIIAATNENLSVAVSEGRFREDLYHRLAVLPIDLPPLRERGDDVELLADRLLARICSDYGLPTKALADDARAALRAHSWPGNVRELSNALERAALLYDDATLTAAVLSLPSNPPARVPTPPSGAVPARERAARERLVEALAKTGWNITHTAVMLGVTRNTVRSHIERYGLGPDREVTQPSPPTIAPAPVEETSVEAFSPPGVRWQPRRVAFLRVVISGGAEGASSASTHALDRAVEKIGSFGGRIEEISRHSLVATFGHHQPAEDAPRRAANAAIAIMKAIERDQFSLDPSRHASGAITVHVARVFVARVGTAMEIDQDAKRDVWRALEETGAAAGGEIAVSDAALAFLSRQFDVHPSAVPGSSAHRLHGRERLAASEEMTFVGRQHETELLQGLLDQMKEGRGQVVTIVGEPGIGKSRLLREFRQALATPAVAVLEGRCAAYGVNVPYFPLLEILQTICGIQDVDSPDAIHAKLGAALERLGPTGAAWLPFLQDLLHPRRAGDLAKLSPEGIKARTFEALTQMVVSRQERDPFVLIIEDLHWIDRTSAEFLAALAEVIIGTRVLLVTTCRSGYQPPWTGRPHTTQIPLGPLSIAESRRLIESVFGGEPEDDALTRDILTRASGNPFFLEELAYAVRQGDGPAGTRMPDTVHDVLAARIEALSSVDRHVLQVAAVLGPDSPAALVQETCDLSLDDLGAGLARLQSGDFLHAGRLGASPTYSFKHALTHEVAYEGVPVADRPRLHARAAAAIERLAPETRERRPEVLARHHAEAGHHAEAVGYWHRAGQLAIRRSAHVDAIAHLTRAAEILETLPEGPDRAHQDLLIQLALAASLTASRGYAAPEVERSLARARGLVDGLGESPQLFLVRWNLWRFYFSRADFRTAEELAVELLAGAGRQGDPMAHLGARVAAGVTKFYSGEVEPAREHLHGALAIYEPAQSAQQTITYGQDLGVAARGFLAWTLAVIGDLDAAAEDSAGALGLAREIDHPFSLALALLLAGEVHQLRREAPIVAALGQELLGLARDHSFTFFTAFGLIHSGWGRALTGDAPEGLLMMRQGADLFRSVGQRVGLAHRAHLAEILISYGSPDESLAVLDDALRQSEETGERAFAAELHRLRGEALGRQARPEEAEACFRAAVALASRQGAWLFALRAASDLVRLGIERGSPASEDLDTLGAILNRFSPALVSSDVETARTLLGEIQ